MVGRRAVGAVLPYRPEPFLDPVDEFFWTSGADGRLRIMRCRGCGWYIHPAAPHCRRCHESDVGPEVVSGRGHVATFTVNHQPWIPGSEPYVIALVELAEQRGLFLTTNLVEIDGDDVSIGLEVEVVFEHAVFEQTGDVWFPLFRPVATASPAAAAATGDATGGSPA
jgi:uncharacterized OB-fold protein